MSMGGGGGGRQQGTATTTQSPDPTVQRLNTQVADELEAAKAATGGVGAFLAPNPLATPTQEELGTLQQISGLTGSPTLSPFESQGLDEMRRAADPTLRLGAASRNFQDIVAPTMTNAAIAGGFGGRSGALLESMGRAGTEMALPISMDVADRQGALGSALMSLGPTTEQRMTDRLYNALGAQGAPRMAALNESLRPQGLYYSQLLGTPVTPGSATQLASNQTTSNSMNWGAMLTPLLAAGLLSMNR